MNQMTVTDDGNGQLATVDNRSTPPLVQFRAQLEKRANEIKAALPSHISPDKFQRTIITAVQSDPDLLTADRQSLILACMKAAQDGLLPDKREAAIVVFNENKKVGGQWVQRKIATYLPMVYGLRKKILQSGEVSALEVGVVYRRELEDGKFYYEVGLEPPLRHRPSFDLTLEDTTDDNIIAAYSIATMKDGTRSYEVMRRFEIDKVREVSKTGATRDRHGKPRSPSGPWVEWFPEQAKKTVMRRHSKTLPMSGDLIVDVEGRELEAGMSAAAVLGSTAGGAPTLIEDRSDGERIDANTGEVLEDRAEPAGAIAADNRAQPSTDQVAQPVDNKLPEERAAEHASDGEPARDELGFTKSPAEEAGERMLSEIKAAQNIIDLNAITQRHEAHMPFLPGEIVDVIHAEAERRRIELGGRPKASTQPQTEDAAQ